MLALTTCFISLPPAVGADERARPNVLVILADDLGFSDLGSYGGEIDTPNLDRLAVGGLRFTQGYNTARCWPTRAALLTGYYPQATGRDALPGSQGGVQGKRPEWARLLPERLGPGELDRPRPWESLTDEQREFQATKMAIHAAMVDVMDREIGRITTQLVAVKGGPRELYDLAADRCETENLATAQPGRVAELEGEWNRSAAECRGLAPAADPPRPLAGRRPNIIYVMTDDQGYGDVAAHGNPVIQTPNLDRLRGQSVRLTEFHVSPTCAPTRAALLTGRHEFRSGITHTLFERERLALDAVTLPQLLRRTANYTTGIFGKWHLGDEDEYQPGRRGFDRVFIHGGGGIGQSFPGSCGDAPGNTYFDPVIRSDGGFVRTKGYCADVFFDAALDWIDRCRQDQKPFFCYVATNTPHAPYDCPPGSDEKYLAPLEAAGIKDPKQRATIAKFYGMIENIDTNVGRLLEKLDVWGLAEDTLLVFTTDNGTAEGAAVCNDSMRGQKASVHRGGTRVPAFWRWEGTLPAGVEIPAVTAHIDILPTLCEIAGATVPPAIAAKLEGRSLVPLLENAEAEWPDRLLVTHLGRWDRGQAAENALRNCRIREGRWQLVNTKNRPDAWELYDLAADPGEEQNLAAAHADVVTRLAQAYDGWWQSVQGNLVNEDLDGPAENPFKTAFLAEFGRDANASEPGDTGVQAQSP